MAGASAGLSGGTNAGCCSGLWWKGQSHLADAIGPARFLGATLIEANRHHPGGILSSAALFFWTRQNTSSLTIGLGPFVRLGKVQMEVKANMQIAPASRENAKEFDTVFAITEAVMGFVPNSMLIWRAILSSSPPLPSSPR